MISQLGILCVTLICILPYVFVAGETKHCYVCNSRGDRGDCKDPYDTVAGRVVHVQPCFTGWCMKTLDTDDNFPATHRTCMNSPPDDNTPRCTTAIDQLPGFPKKIYVCYCKGDLCNSAVRSSMATSVLTFFGVVLTFLVGWYLGISSSPLTCA